MNKNLFFLLLIINVSYIHGMKRLSAESNDLDPSSKKQENIHNIFQAHNSVLRNIFSHEAFKKCEITSQSVRWWALHNSMSEDNAASDIKIDSRGHFAAIASGDKIFYINLKSEDPYDGSYMLTNHDRVRAISMGGNCLARAAGLYVEILDAKTAISKAIFYHPTAEKICLSPDGNLLAIASGFKIEVRDKKTKKVVSEHDIEYFYHLQIKPLMWDIFEKNDPAIGMCKGISSLQLDNDGNISVIFASRRMIVYRPTQASLDVLPEDEQFIRYGYLTTNSRYGVTIVNDRVCVIDSWAKQNKDVFKIKGVTAACTNDDATILVTGSGDGTVRIFNRYTDCTLWAREQLILKDALLNWFLIEKPNKKIVSLTALLDDVAHKFGIFLPYIVCGWKSFPENFQKMLESTMLYRIQKYGKDPVLL